MKLMGILNVTPDSFFDGGKYSVLDSAVKRAEEMVSEGADYIDVGGESTRPGARTVSADEELKRVLPIVKRLVKKFPRVPLSVDTQKSQVARAALEEGARIINDISALNADGEMVHLVNRYKPITVLMHMQGCPQSMQQKPQYKNVVQEIKNFLSGRVRWAVRNGFPKKKIWIDPGIGFGKTVEHNLKILAHLKNFLTLGCPILIGHSRKSFVGRVCGEKKVLPVEERLEGTLAVACWSFLEGASVLRVHDVGETKKTLRMMAALSGAR